MVKDKEKAMAYALALLKDEAIQRLLIDVFVFYAHDLNDIVNIATVENAGKRPERLSNEVFSSFHHVARGLCVEDANPGSEFTSAQNTHLKRAALDSYKIAINSILEEDDKAKELLDYLVLVEDFSRYVPDGFNKTNEIKTKSRSVKEHYKKAKKCEALGDFSGAIEYFNRSLEECYDLRKLLEVFTHDRSYILAVAREAKQKQEKARDRRNTIIAACFAALLSSIATYFAPRLFGPVTTQQIAPSSSVHAAPGQAAPAPVSKKSLNP